MGHVEVLQAPEVGEEGVGQDLDQVVAGRQLSQVFAGLSGQAKRRVKLPHPLTCNIHLILMLYASVSSAISGNELDMQYAIIIFGVNQLADN